MHRRATDTHQPETATRSNEPETALARVMREQGRKQKWLQGVLGIGKNRVSLLIAGEREMTLWELQRVSEALGVPVETFLPEKEGAA